MNTKYDKMTKAELIALIEDRAKLPAPAETQTIARNLHSGDIVRQRAKDSDYRQIGSVHWVELRPGVAHVTLEFRDGTRWEGDEKAIWFRQASDRPMISMGATPPVTASDVLVLRASDGSKWMFKRERKAIYLVIFFHAELTHVDHWPSEQKAWNDLDMAFSGAERTKLAAWFGMAAL